MNLRQRIKEVMASELMLEVSVDEIADDAPLFGPNGIGLDSVDALQLVVAIEKHFKLKISDQTKAREILHSVDSIAQAIEEAGLA
ncbi:phosphopantetheine-binding protein [Brevifollis gellanilyticus]|jgi:acyl carrier protein|nr:phosphopantetheine-binding protein [Brevifollis gellanilyticus]